MIRPNKTYVLSLLIHIIQKISHAPTAQNPPSPSTRPQKKKDRDQENMMQEETTRG